jgi:hypothetical protein
MRKESIRKWYRAGGRLRVPIEFRIDVGEGGYKVVGAQSSVQMTNKERNAWTWLKAKMWRAKVKISVSIAWIDAYCEVKRWRVDWEKPVLGVEITLWDYGKSLGLMMTEGGVSIHGESREYEDVREAERVRIFFEHLKLEIEERVNGFLEKVLFA